MRRPGRPKHSTVARLPIHREEHEAFIQHINQVVEKFTVAERLIRIATILHHTGMRISEVLLLKKGHILDAMNEGKFSLSNETKTKTTRLIILSKKGKEEFKELFEMEGWEYEDRQDLLFVNKDNKPMKVQSITKLMNKHIKLALGELYSSHSYRQGYCTDLLTKAKAPANIVQKLVGHKNLSTTLRYNYASENDLLDALEQVR